MRSGVELRKENLLQARERDIKDKIKKLWDLIINRAQDMNGCERVSERNINNTLKIKWSYSAIKSQIFQIYDSIVKRKHRPWETSEARKKVTKTHREKKST